MQLVADLHIHSRFSRATSRDLDFVALHRAACEKGVGLVGTGDFSHPGWMAEIREQLEPAEEGWFRLRPELRRAAERGLPAVCRSDVRFVLQVEISNIYKKHDRVRKNHNLVFVPSLDAARRLGEALAAIGNIASDGRPILGLDARDLLEITLDCDPLAFLVPAHIWTPWFSMLGSKSGFDALDECFEDLSEHVFAAETGLSSDPPMNWRLSHLDRITLISNSDAHSAAKLGREANLLDIEPGYEPMLAALKTGQGFAGTLEFFPEEGKYHLDGHRKCGLRLEPEETRALGGRCPVCGGTLTVGVMSRVLDLADRPHGARPEGTPSFHSLVPLAEIVCEVLAVGPGSKRVRTLIDRLLAELGPELRVLRELPLEDIEAVSGAPLVEAVRRVRAGQLHIAAGYDGEFGTVQIFAPGERERLFGQLSFLVPEVAAPDHDRARARQRAARVREPGSVARDNLDRVRDADPLAGLDADQLRAVETPSGPLLVVAGPGTGKTRTIVARIAHLVQSGAVDRDRVVAIAFTNQAADELRERLDAVLRGDIGGAPLVTTFHGLGARILQGLTGARVEVVDDAQRLELVRGAFGVVEPGRRELNELVARISLAKQGCDPEAALAGDDLEAYRRYQIRLAELGRLDVDDLVLRPYTLLASDNELAAQTAQRFRLVAVDEYQDVNDVQAGLIALICPGGVNLCAIGDPDQAIYGFRGARPGHFARFAEAFPGTTVVSLQTSYRLGEQVLAAARSVVVRPAKLRALRPGLPVEVVACPTPDSEAEQVVVRLERIVGGTSYFAVDSGRGDEAELAGVGFGDVAVLCRTRVQRREILEALGRSAIPCRAVGEDEAHDPRSQKVAVMTMHAAKGREFEVVFITGVEDGLLPLEREGLSADPDEERRLLYVAITRARRLAVISHAARRTLWGRALPGRPSPFLANLPEHAVRRVTPDLGKPKPASRQMRLF